jgi:hypothetical protein
MAMKGWRTWSEAEARAELALWKRSGQSLVKFTDGRGYSEGRLRWWRKQLGDASRAPPPTALVPVHVVGVERSAIFEAPIEVAVRGGHVVRVRRGFDTDTLLAVMRAVEGPC